MNQPRRHRRHPVLTFTCLISAALCCRCNGGLGGPSAGPDLATGPAADLRPADLGAGLSASGAVSDECAPNDGPALVFLVGTSGVCDATAEAAPQVRFYGYPGSTKALAAGQSFRFTPQTMGQMLSASWFPEGTPGRTEPVEAGSVEVQEVAGPRARIRYSFTVSGATRQGEAVLSVCPKTPRCG